MIGMMKSIPTVSTLKNSMGSGQIDDVLVLWIEEYFIYTINTLFLKSPGGPAVLAYCKPRIWRRRDDQAPAMVTACCNPCRPC